MPTTEEQLAQTQQRLNEVEALQRTVQKLREQLKGYRTVLDHQLNRLQEAAMFVELTPPPPSSQDLTTDLEASSEPVSDDGAEDLDLVEQGAGASEPSPQSAAEPVGERRAALRRAGNPIQVRITRIDNGDLLEGWVVDRSSGGIRILTDQVIDPKTVLNIQPIKAISGFPWIKTEVRNCKPERGGYSLGCMFLQKLTWGELQAFG